MSGKRRAGRGAGPERGLEGGARGSAGRGERGRGRGRGRGGGGGRGLGRPATAPPVRAPALVIAGQRGRGEARRAKQRRNRLVAALVALVLVLGGGIAAGLALQGGAGLVRDKRVSGGRSQHTLLFALRASDGDAVESALLAHDSTTRSGVEVLLPAQVISEVPGAGSEPFGNALGLPNGALLSRAALADLMGITVDASWVIDEATFAALVNRLGGVHVNVDTTVTSPIKGGGAVVVLNPGPQLLDGAQAVAYATFIGAGQPPVTMLPRLQGVLDGLMAALPKAPTEISGLLTGLGTGSSVGGLAPSAVARLLAGFAADDAASNVNYATLPVVPIDTGAAQLSYRIDAAGVRALVRTQLADSIPPGVATGNNRVLVENGVGTPGLGLSARQKLVKAGLQFVGSVNAPQFGHAHTRVLIFSATAQAEALGNRVARALGVNPVSAVRLSPLDQSIADVIVILGADYRP